jgi:hypothetical protein
LVWSEQNGSTRTTLRPGVAGRSCRTRLRQEHGPPRVEILVACAPARTVAPAAVLRLVVCQLRRSDEQFDRENRPVEASRTALMTSWWIGCRMLFGARG